jgi:hypothetical protein
MTKIEVHNDWILTPKQKQTKANKSKQLKKEKGRGKKENLEVQPLLHKVNGSPEILSSILCA